MRFDPVIVFAAAAALVFGAGSVSLAAGDAADKPAADAAPAAPIVAPDNKDPKEQSLDELLNLPGKKPVVVPDGKKPVEKPDPGPPGVKPSDEAPPAGDPFVVAVAAMKQAAGRLSGEDTGIDTQRLQERVVLQLDQLISQYKPKKSKPKDKPKSREKDDGADPADGQAESQKPGQSQKPGTEASRGGLGPAAEEARLKEEQLAEKLAEWGNLPPRLRDQLLQGMEDRFSNVYREITEKYYRRLAEQNK